MTPDFSMKDLSPKTISILDFCQVGIIIQEKAGKILFANTAACTIFRMTRKQLIGKYSSDTIWNMTDESGHPLTGDQHPSMRTLQTRKPLKDQVCGLFSDDKDRMIWLRINTNPLKEKPSGEINGVIITFTEITGEKNVLQDLKDGEERLKALSDSTFEAVFLSDQGVCIDCNKAAEELFGYSRDELIGIFGTDVIAQEHKELVRHKMMNKITTPYQALAQRKDGSTFWAQFRGRMFQFQGKEIRITAVIDIDEQINTSTHLEEIVNQRTKEIEEKNQQLESSQIALTNLLEDVNESREELQQVVKRLTEARDELESFSYSVSHDLKAPLRAIDGFSHILYEEYADKLDEQGLRYLKTVRENTQFMGTLIQDLLDFSRAARSVLHPEPIDSKEMITSIVDTLMAHEGGRKISVKLKDLPTLFADKHLLNQVFYNLISNAIKFTRTKAHAKIEVSGDETPKEYIFTVKDNGVGFDMKYIKKLFNVFQRLHTMDEYEGTGVGLALVKRIIKKLGGDSEAREKPNMGATFRFTLSKIVVKP